GLNSAYQILVVPVAQRIRTQFEQDVWEQGFCPICGTGPEMGKISGKDGHFYLSCALCFTEWKYSRIGCPFCGNTNHQELSHFSSDEYKGFRVNICRKCDSYIKVTLETDLNRKHVPVVDSIITLELDSVAIDEGFQHGEICYEEIKS
ncbi:MAG: formate dehydrogenase accessory protein FdhE, partial [bacterium]